MYRYRYPKVQLLSFSCLIVAGKMSGAVGDAPETFRNPVQTSSILKKRLLWKERALQKGSFVLVLKRAEA